MNTLRYVLFYIIIILSPNIVSASDLKEEFGLKYYGKILYSERTPNAIYIFDQIKIGDVFDFRASLRENNISIVVLNSPGGSPLTSMIGLKNVLRKGQLVNLSETYNGKVFKEEKTVWRSICLNPI